MVGLLALAGPGWGQSAVALDARLIWIRGDDLYLAAPDSIAVMPGTRLTLMARGKTLATAEVSRILDRPLALARLTSGSLREIKDLRRIRLIAEPARTPGHLRLGYPSSARSSPLFACDGLSIRRTGPLSEYRLEQNARGARLIRAAEHPSSDGPIAWPDTIEIRRFDDVADQEIALERGELDVAVFWPGELSTHMRERPRWKDRLSGVMTRGWIGVIRPEPRADSLADYRESAVLAALNRELFRGDLREWNGATGGIDRMNASLPPRARFEVDAGFPGKPTLEAFLNRSSVAGPGGESVVRIFRLDCACPATRDVLRWLADHIREGPYPAGLRAQADSLALVAASDPDASSPWDPGKNGSPLERLGVHFPLAIACPVVCDPVLLPYVRTLGAEAFVNLLACGRPER